MGAKKATAAKAKKEAKAKKAAAKKAAKAKKAAAKKVKKVTKKAKPSKKAKVLKKKPVKKAKKAKKLIEFMPDLLSTPVVALFGALSCTGVALAILQFRRSVSNPSKEPLLIH